MVINAKPMQPCFNIVIIGRMKMARPKLWGQQMTQFRACMRSKIFEFTLTMRKIENRLSFFAL